MTLGPPTLPLEVRPTELAARQIAALPPATQDAVLEALGRLAVYDPTIEHESAAAYGDAIFAVYPPGAEHLRIMLRRDDAVPLLVWVESLGPWVVGGP